MITPDELRSRLALRRMLHQHRLARAKRVKTILLIAAVGAVLSMAIIIAWRLA